MSSKMRIDFPLWHMLRTQMAYLDNGKQCDDWRQTRDYAIQHKRRGRLCCTDRGYYVGCVSVKYERSSLSDYVDVLLCF